MDSLSKAVEVSLRQVPYWQYLVAQERPKFGQLVIPTLDSVRYEHLMTLVHSVGKVRSGAPTGQLAVSAPD